MKKYQFEMPGEGETIIVTKTEGEIIDDYYPRWSSLMRKKHKAYLISERRCISDWITVNGAWEVDNDRVPYCKRTETI